MNYKISTVKKKEEMKTIKKTDYLKILINI